MIAPTGGSIEFEGRDITRDYRHRARENPELFRALQMVFQNPERSLNPSMTAGQTISRSIVKLLGRRLDREDLKSRCLEIMGQVGLDASYYGRRPHQMSGGEKQRVAIARVSAAQPDLVICDEPTSALDVSVQAAVLNLLADLQNDSRASYLFISHDLSVVRYGRTYRDPAPLGAARDLTLATLRQPLGCPPLRELARDKKRVVIGFPDRVKGGAQPASHRRTAIPLIVEELLAGGAELENITLICCEGLHRKNTVEEFQWYLGPKIVELFYPGRLLNHDAEEDVLDLGLDDMGNVVQCSKKFAEADLAIVLGHAAGNPYGGFSGGYKMIVTGLTGARSIASHHCPGTMHRPDWMGACTPSHMRRQFRSIGQAMEEKIGHKFFAVDAVTGQFADVLDVKTGLISEVEKATWPLARRRTDITLTDLSEPADILLMGLPRNFHYGPGMGTNPVLASLAIGGQLSRCWRALRPAPVIIAAACYDGWFNDHLFPSYRETYEKLLKYQAPADFLGSAEAAEISRRYEYCYQYSNQYAYHPFHAMSMISGGGAAALNSSAIIMVGAQNPGMARSMGYQTVADLPAALKTARRFTGDNPRILCTPECFSGGSAVHLNLGRD